MKPAAKACAVVSLALLQFALASCGLFAPTQAGAQTGAAKNPPPVPDISHDGDRAPAESRKVGDFSVHRFSGSYQKAPLTLTEEVVGFEFGLWVIDYTFEEQTGTTKLRVRFNPRTEAVFSVAKLDGAKESSVPISVYDQLIERTSFAADANDGVVAQGRTTCLVGPSELDCETKTYKVRVGDKFGTLTVSHNAQVASGDVTGDLIADDGTVIYRSELLEMGNSGSSKHDVASR